VDFEAIAAQRDTYRRDGVVCIPGAFDRDALADARSAWEWSVANPGRAANVFEGEGRFYQDLLNPMSLARYEPMLRKSPAVDIVRTLWDDPNVWYMYEQVFLKEGGETRRTPWHQDSSYLPVEGDRIAVIWITFDPVARADALEFVRGSHRGPMYDGSRFDPKDDTAPLYGDGSLPRLPNIEAERGRYDIVGWAVEPGDVVVFHPGVLHGGGATHKGGRRRTLSLRFFGSDAVFALRPGMKAIASMPRPKPANPEEEAGLSVFARIATTLRPGDPLRHPSFLKLSPRAA
jgi:ectoine hydroxylase-related dioxygenase (phytanoyl-CoA dioxygenase family)